jgi:hypothetical protein
MKFSKKRVRQYRAKLSQAELQKIERLQDEKMDTILPYLVRTDGTHL